MALKGALGPFGPYGPRGALLGDLERRNDLLQLIGLIGELSGELGHILRIAQSLFGHLRDLHEVAVHIVQNAGLLLSCASDMSIHVVDLAYRGVDDIEGVTSLLCLIHGDTGLLTAAGHNFHGTLGVLLVGLDQVNNTVGRFLSTLG